MKKIILLICVFCAFIENINAQNITDTRTIGSWVHSAGKGNLDHFKPGAIFPPTTIKGPIKVGYGTDKTLKLTPAVQNKMKAILQVFKDAYPNPYKESVCYGVNYTPANVGDKPLAYNIHLGDYGFQYDKLGKVKPINPASQFGNMYEGYGNVYVNYVPLAYRLTDLIGSLNIVNALTYYNGHYGENNLKPKGEVIMIAPQNNFAAEIKSWKHTNAPSEKFGNEADNYFSIRQLTGYVDKNKNTTSYKVANYVVVSTNNQFPFKPISREEFLNLLEENLNEEAEEAKNRFENYVKNTEDYKQNKKSIDKTNEENFNDRKRKYDVINLLRKTFKNDLNLPTILNTEHSQLAKAGFYYLFNRKEIPTIKEIKDVFIIDKKLGYALYRRDNDFYKNLKEDDVKTITLEWMDIIDVPLNEKFPDANAKNKDALFMVDVNYRAAIRYKFDWVKLAGLLTK